MPSLGFSQITFKNYHQYDEIKSTLQTLNSKYPETARIIKIGESASKKDLLILEIAAKTAGSGETYSRPAIFVSANIDGTHLIGSEAALKLAETLLENYRIEEQITTLLETKTVYIAPLLNPDAAQYFFNKPKQERQSNNNPMDDDLDGKIDEDGPDDLNKNGLITLMRVKDQYGDWIIDAQDPRLMRKVDTLKNDIEKYNIFTEGIDNDRDGKYNEDPIGGVNLNHNFPFEFEYKLNKTRTWPESEKETVALLEFLFDHPNISLVLSFSEQGSLLDFQQFTTTNEKVKIPQNLVNALGMKNNSKYTLNELVEIIKKKNILSSGTEINENTIAKFLGNESSEKIDDSDIPYFIKLQNDYKKLLKEANLLYTKNNTINITKGSFVPFCYYQYGVFVFSTDLWNVPNLDSAAISKSDQNNENVHPNYHSLKWSDDKLNGKGFVNWQPYKHPTLGDVEIGGFVPFVKINPPVSEIDKILSVQTNFFIELMQQVAELRINDITVRRIENNLYKIIVQFINPGWFPTSTAFSRESLTYSPIIVRLKIKKNQSIYSGEPMEIIEFIEGDNGIAKIEWTVKGPRGSTVIVTADSPKLGSVKETIELK